MKNLMKTISLTLALISGMTFLLAQESDEVMGTLDEFYVRDITVEESILPTTRPFNSVYGTDRNVLDTPILFFGNVFSTHLSELRDC